MLCPRLWSGQVNKLAIVASLAIVVCAGAEAQTRAFSVTDDIEMSRFPLHTSDAGRSAVLPSPDGALIAVMTNRGLVNRNLIEDSIWIWRAGEVQPFLAHPEQITPPQP